MQSFLKKIFFNKHTYAILGFGFAISVLLWVAIILGWSLYDFLEGTKVNMWSKIKFHITHNYRPYAYCWFGFPIYLIMHFFWLVENIDKKTNKNKTEDHSKWLSSSEINKITNQNKLNNSGHSWGWVVKTNKKSNPIINSVKDNHALIIGSTGSGKTQNIIFPTIINNINSKEKPSMVVSDPKGAIYNEIKKLAIEAGYKIYVLDFINFKGNKWNPLRKVEKLWRSRDYENAEKYINIFVESIMSSLKGAKDPFWSLSAKNLVNASIIYLLIKNLKSTTSITPAMIIKFLNKGQKSIITKFKENIDNEFLANYAGQLLTESKTFDSILLSASAGLKNLTNNSFKKMTVQNDFDLKNIQEKPSIVILKTHLTDSTFYFLNQLYIETLLLDLMDMNNLNQTRPILFLLDEFGNIPEIKSFVEVISSSREYNVWFMMVLQFYSQLDKYRKASGIVANCGLKYYLHTNDMKTAKMISEEYGNKKVIARSSNKSNTSKTSTSSREVSKPLIEAYELTKLEPNTMIIKIQRKDPFKIKTLPWWKIKEKVN